MEPCGLGWAGLRLGGIGEVVDDHKQSRHFTTSFLVPYVQQGPWGVMYVKNRVPRGTLG
jgi:hypothetical protein